MSLDQQHFIVGKYFFEEDANSLADFQNKPVSGKRTWHT